MILKNIKKEAKKLSKKLKGDISVSNIAAYIESLGYTIIYFNTPEGDYQVKSCKVQEQAAELQAFTYCDNVKYVFVDNNAHSADKLYLLLHELGHILLGHLNGDIILLEHDLRLDNETETFSFHVLHYRKNKILPIALVMAVAISIGSFFIASSYIRHNNHNVYITRTGESFHRSSCISVQGKNTAPISRNSAKKLFDPCQICNP